MSLVIFDCDGVLVDSEAIESAVFAALLTEAGLPTTAHDIHARYLGLGFDVVEADLAGRMGKPLPPDLIARLHSESRERLAEAVLPIPGVLGAIDAIEAAGWRTAIGSAGPRGKMAATLGRVGLWDRFQGRLFGQEDVAATKPAPDVYLLAAASQGVAPSDCTVVEDSPNGVRAGVAAGMRVFAYCGDSPADKLLAAGAHAVFADMAHLPGLVGRA